MRTWMRAALLALAACGDNDGGGSTPVDARPADAAADAAVDAAPCMPAAQRPVLATLTSGEVVIGAAAVEGTAELMAPLDRSILFVSLRENESSPQHGGVQCILREADTVANTPAGVRCRRNTQGTDTTGSTGEISVRWTVATFTSGVTVQRGIANTGFTNPSIVTLATPADPTKSFVLLGGVAVNGSGWSSNEFQRARLVDANTVDIRTTTAGSETAYQVVTMAGAAVQRGTATLANAATSAQVPVTKPGVVLATYNTDNASSIAAAALMLRASISGGNVSFERDAGGTAIDVAWEVVSMPFFTRSFSTQLAAGTATQTQAVEGTSVASSVALASNQAVLGQTAGSTAYAGADLDLLGEAAASLSVANGEVTVQRAATSAAANIAWSVIDFSRDECAGL